MNATLRLPLRNIQLNQGFGFNYLDFYKKMGLPGHPGLDFRAYDGFECHSANIGIVTRAGKFSDGGIGVEVWNQANEYSTFYYHLKDVTVKIGDNVVAGQVIGHCDNTGKYTTNDHLHFELRVVDDKGERIQSYNDYKGSIDPTPYFTMAYDGTPIKNKDCYESNAYHRYFRKDGRNYKIEVRILGELLRYLKWMPKQWQINSAVYGSWDRESIANPAMYQLCAYITKGEYIKGKLPFID